MKTQLRRTIDVQCRILSESEGLVEYVASDATLDSYQESILSSGWRFSMFQRNAPFVDSHLYGSIAHLLGRVDSARVEGGQLIETVRWAKDVEEHSLAKLGWKMTVAGFLRAVSVGFRAVRYVSPGGEGWGDAVTAAGLSPDDAGRCRRIFTEQEQLELSACVIGANPAAVARAYDAGAISEGDMAACGLSETDMNFLTVAGRAMQRTDLDELSRLLIGREMMAIQRKSLTGFQTPSPSPSPSMPGGDDAAARQASEKAEFLRRFEALVKA